MMSSTHNLQQLSRILRHRLEQQCLRWDLFRDGVTAPLLTEFIRCRERCRLRYDQRWTDRKGTITEEVEVGLDWMLGQLASTRILSERELLAIYESLWRAEVPDPDEEQLRRHDTTVAFLAALLNLHFAHFQEVTSHFRIYPDETYAPWPFANGTQTRLRRRLLIDGDDSSPSLVETRVVRNIDPNDVQAGLPVDLRAMLGLVMIPDVCEVYPASVTYNVIQLETIKRMPYETAEAFQQRTVQRLAHSQDHFQQVVVPVRGEIVDDWQDRCLFPLMESLDHWFREGPHFISPLSDRCWSGLFRAAVYGDFANCYRRPMLFSSLEI